VVAATVGFATLAVTPWAHAELPPLVPREVFFPPPPAMQDFRISPDGHHLSYLAPDAERTPQLWLRDPGRKTTRQLTAVDSPGVSSYAWAENSRLVCYERRHDTGPRLIGVELASGTERTLIAIDGARIGTLTTRPTAPTRCS
jgi:hypothetical protein